MINASYHNNIYTKLIVAAEDNKIFGYQSHIVHAEIDGYYVELARTNFATYVFHNGEWVVKKPGLISAWENEAGWLLYSPEISRVMAHHLKTFVPLREYKNTAQKVAFLDHTLSLSIQYGFRSTGWCLMSESSKSVNSLNRHRRVSPFFATQQEAESLLLALEEQERFGIKQVVLPTTAYPIVLPTRTRNQEGLNLNYYITASDNNTYPYDTGDNNSDNPWAMPMPDITPSASDKNKNTIKGEQER